MLTIRLFPTGRKHRKTYRLVVAQKHRHVTKKFVENLGWYNPLTKEVNFNKERLNYYLGLNLEMSDTVRSLLYKHSLLK